MVELVEHWPLGRSVGSVRGELMNLLVLEWRMEEPLSYHHPRIDEVQPVVGAVE